MKKQLIHSIFFLLCLTAGDRLGAINTENMQEKDINAWMLSSAWNRELPFKPDASINLYAFAEQIRLNGADWQAAFEFLKGNDLAKMPEGRYDLTENGAYATVSTYLTKSRDTSRYEAHREYIDIQYVAKGSEYMEWLPLRNIHEEQRYNPEGDILFFEDKTAGRMLYADKGRYFIFFPEDAHKPCLKTDQPGEVKKVVVKVPYKKP